MRRIIPYDKMSKKQRRQVDLAKRNTFLDYGCLDPTTKVAPNKKKELRKSMCRKNISVSM